MKQQYFDKMIALLIVLLIMFAIFLRVSTVNSTKNLQNDEIEKSKQYAAKIITLLKLKTKSNIEKKLTEKIVLRDDLNKILQAFLTKQYQYIFLLYKDKKEHYRFLLDGSKEEPESFKTLFFPKSNLFDEVYKTKKMQIVEQSDGVEKVWLSLVFPVVNNNNIEALLVLDLSKEYAQYLHKFNSPLMRVVTFMQWFLLLSLLLLAFLAYKYYTTRKTLIQDKLTGVYTKYYLNEFFNSNRIDNYHAFLLDIDEFKKINKKYGDTVGDKVLKKFTQRMNNNLSSKSRIIRTSGTEFFIVTPKEENKINIISNKIYKILKDNPYVIDNESILLSLSMSAMLIPKNSDKIQNIIRRLDEKLLEIKNYGKNHLIIIDNVSLEEVKYTNIEYIKEALEDERFICLYQPIFKTKNKEIVKYEALVRMVDKDDKTNLISPWHFLKVIKGTSQYIKMSKLVLNEVFTALNKYPSIELSINLDLDDLYNSEMMQLINDYLYTHQENAQRLTFEIIEENDIYDYDKVNDIFKDLCVYGSKIAIDDFGSGYANYSYLSRLKIDILKIDGSLIRDLHIEPQRAKIVLQSIKNLAEQLDIELIAEFVSDDILYKIINDIGIEFSQGYILGEPKPIEEYLK